eukprot:TRINITY_DN7893_c0_g1_i1.p1 TRINITY_DN7893_c0_g1~~TRINITY_DN7893_c0_g1_i1.p1  ORF type:complete len:189 (-),score=34.15 TRINITY_DN7893_c0_g1_i1:311-856(-)
MARNETNPQGPDLNQNPDNQLENELRIDVPQQSPQICHPLDQTPHVIAPQDLPEGYHFGGPLEDIAPHDNPYVEMSGHQPDHVIEPEQPDIALLEPVWSDTEQEMICPHCLFHGFSIVSRRPPIFIIFAGMIILIVGIFFWPLLFFLILLIPFLLPPFWTARHYCPSCSEHLGSFNRLYLF